MGSEMCIRDRANGAGMPALGLSAAAVLVKGLVVRCDLRLPSRPKGVKLGKNRSIRSN